MITHVEMSFQMGFITKLIEINLKRYGHVNPLIVAINKGKEIPLDLNFSTILDTKICRVRGGVLLTEEESDPEDIYIHVVMLRLRSDEDEVMLQKIYNHIAKLYDPDAMGYSQSCLYNEYSDPSSISRETMLKDPENIHVIHMCYYLRGDKKARISIMPYLNKGPNKDADKEVSFSPGEEEEVSDYVVMLSDCGWLKEYSKIEPIRSYPYKRERKLT